jgi:hypothetical protein
MGKALPTCCAGESYSTRCATKHRDDTGPIAITDTSPATALPGGLRARTVASGVGGAVSVLLNLNAAGTSVRRFALPTPAEPLPFKLILLK